MTENAKYKEVAKFWEDFEIGEKSETKARTITQTDIVMHAMHSGDWMPHHTDAEWCKTQPFKKPIMHGSDTHNHAGHAFDPALPLAKKLVNGPHLLRRSAAAGA